MHRDLIIRAAAVAAASSVLLASTVAGQDLDALPPPPQREDARTQVVFNDIVSPTINARIDAAAKDGQKDIGAPIQPRKPKNGGGGYWTSDLSSTSDVVLEAIKTAPDRDIVLISGGDSMQSVGGAKAAPGTHFVDIGQPLPCVTADSIPDRSGICAGGADAVPVNYMAINFKVEDPAYLAGVIAASAASTGEDRLGIISGLRDCEECNRYIQGFIRGAQSVEPDVEIVLAFLSDDDEATAFDDAAAGQAFAEAFIEVHEPDVIMPITRAGQLGIIEAACDAGILAVGTDFDVRAHSAELKNCVLTSITKDVESAVRGSFRRFTEFTFEPVWDQTLTEGGVGITDDWTRQSAVPAAALNRYDDALNAILTSTIQTCPDDCGQPYGPGVGEDAEAEADAG